LDDRLRLLAAIHISFAESEKTKGENRMIPTALGVVQRVERL